MKKKTGNKIRLGILVSASIALFIAGIYFVGEKQQLFTRTFRISGIFKNIGGLQIGNNVRFSGINVGIIENIQQITDSTVLVDMMISESTRKFIKKNATAIISSDGFIGNKNISIIPGPPGAPELADNDRIETVQPVTMDDIMQNMKVTSANASNITYDLACIMKNIHDGKGTIGKLVMDNSLALNVDSALVNIKQGAGGFKQNMDAAGHNILLKGYIKKKEKEKDKDNDTGKK